MSPTTDATLVDHRGRKYLTADERSRFLAAVRAHHKPAVQTLARTLAMTGCAASAKPWRFGPATSTSKRASCGSQRSSAGESTGEPSPSPKTAQTARTCIYGHLEEHHANYPAVSRLQVDDNVPGREHALGRPRHAMSALAL